MLDKELEVSRQLGDGQDLSSGFVLGGQQHLLFVDQDFDLLVVILGGQQEAPFDSAMKLLQNSRPDGRLIPGSSISLRGRTLDPAVLDLSGPIPGPSRALAGWDQAIRLMGGLGPLST